MGGGEGKALYIDTEGTFRPQRLQQIAERYLHRPTHKSSCYNPSVPPLFPSATLDSGDTKLFTIRKERSRALFIGVL